MPASPHIQPVVIFLSAVTREFHTPNPRDPRAFRSYRAALAESLDRIRQPHEIVSQENLAQGPGDLLDTLDREIK